MPFNSFKMFTFPWRSDEASLVSFMFFRHSSFIDPCFFSPGKVWNRTDYGRPWCQNALRACDAGTLEETQANVSVSSSFILCASPPPLTAPLNLASPQNAEADQAIRGPPLRGPHRVVRPGDGRRRRPGGPPRQVLLQPQRRDPLTALPGPRPLVSLLLPSFMEICCTTIPWAELSFSALYMVQSSGAVTPATPPHPPHPTISAPAATTRGQFRASLAPD